MSTIRLNLIGQIYGCLGIPNHTRGLFEAFIKHPRENFDTPELSIGVYPIVPQRDSYDRSAYLDGHIESPSELQNAEGISIIFWTPDIYPNILPRFNRKKSILIGYLVFEWTKLSPEFVRNADLMDYLAVPSFAAKGILVQHGISPNKILVVRAGLSDTFLATGSHRRPIYKGNAESTKFLMCGKWEERKSYTPALENILPFIEDTCSQLCLAIDDPFDHLFDIRDKVRAAQYACFGKDRLPVVISGHGFAHNAPNTVTVIPRRKLSASAHMRELFHSCHFLVAPSRAGGVELPLIEAMSCASIPIAPCVSGMASYLPDEALKLKVSGMVPMRDNRWFKGPTDFGVWAEIDWQDFRDKIKEAHDMPSDVFRTRTEACIQHVSDICNYENIVDKFFKDLKRNENARSTEERVVGLQKM
jgi:hypothetical protein